MQTILLGALTVLLPAAPVGSAPDEGAETTAEPEHVQNYFGYSGYGPGAGKTVIGVGGRLLYVLPMLDFHAVYGFTDNLDFEARASSLALLSVADVGVRYRIAGDQELSIAARGGAHAVGIFAIIAGGVSAGPALGLVGSMGSDDWQLSLSQDVPIHLFQAADVDGKTASGSNIALVSRTTLAFETMVAKETSLYVAGQLYVPIVSGNVGVLPFLAIGASF